MRLIHAAPLRKPSPARKGAGHMDRRWMAVLIAAAAAGCHPVAGDDAALSSSQTRLFDPAGTWIRTDGDPAHLIITHRPQGPWVVESIGTNGFKPCGMVFAGTLKGLEIIASGDADTHSNAPVTRDGLIPGEGLFVTFGHKVAVVSGPEADAAGCALAGAYVRKAGG